MVSGVIIGVLESLKKAANEFAACYGKRVENALTRTAGELQFLSRVTDPSMRQGSTKLIPNSAYWASSLASEPLND
jgi:hypothetical protein